MTALTWAWETYRAAHTGKARPDARAEWTTRWWPGALEVIRHSIDPSKCPPGWHLMSKQDQDDDKAEAKAREQHGDEAPSDNAAKTRQARISARPHRGAGRARQLDGPPLAGLGAPDRNAGQQSRPELWLPTYLEAAAEDVRQRRWQQRAAPPQSYQLPRETTDHPWTGEL